MAREFLPLMMKDLEISVPDARIHRLALNRHMPRVEKVDFHHHENEQLLLYLRGSGIQIVEGRRIPIRRGVLIFLRGGQTHGFQKERNISPVCLAIDLELEDRVEWPVQSVVSGEGLLTIEQSLHQLANFGKRSVLGVASAVLAVVGTLEEELAKTANPVTGKHARLVSEWISRSEIKDLSARNIADDLGKSIDHLNRQLKNEANTSLGRLISLAKFESASRMLRESSLPVGEIASEIGMLDQNYFARWFRKQSGLTPTQWRKGGSN
jgi:AraC-like DNA-binding protein